MGRVGSPLEPSLGCSGLGEIKRTWVPPSRCSVYDLLHEPRLRYFENVHLKPAFRLCVRGHVFTQPTLLSSHQMPRRGERVPEASSLFWRSKGGTGELCCGARKSWWRVRLVNSFAPVCWGRFCRDIPRRPEDKSAGWEAGVCKGPGTGLALCVQGVGQQMHMTGCVTPAGH